MVCDIPYTSDTGVESVNDHSAALLERRNHGGQAVRPAHAVHACTGSLVSFWLSELPLKFVRSVTQPYEHAAYRKKCSTQRREPLVETSPQTPVQLGIASVVGGQCSASCGIVRPSLSLMLGTRGAPLARVKSTSSQFF